MRVLVLGASGHVGRRLAELLAATSWAVPVRAGRGSHGAESLRLDSCELQGMTNALQGMDAVVNCVAGSARAIAEGSRVLVQAALAAACPRIVHLSTMSVYGPAEGLLAENAPLDPSLGWYARAKCEAEAQMRNFVQRGGQALVFRPGCIYGPGSELWVGRTAQWLHASRLGDLGIAGDGWSNLVHVDDVCQALMAALRLPVQPGDCPVFNLAAPDSPRWNEYFVDLALEIQATPVRRVTSLQLQLDARVAGPPLHIARRVCKALDYRADALPHAMPPGLLRLWAQHIRLDASLAERCLGISWTAYATGLKSSAGWLRSARTPAHRNMGKAVWTP
jgi:nucleoside-diphosphate-sugar epimerase